MLAAVLVVGLMSNDVDLSALVRHYEQMPAAVCGIKVVGYQFNGRPGQQFVYGRKTITIPAKGYILLIARRRVKHYRFDGRRLSLDEGNGPLDAFSFRWINLPAPPANGGTSHESPDQPHTPGPAGGTH